SNWLRALPAWCASIALCDGPEPLDGGILDPVRTPRSTATRGGGPQLNEKRIRVADRKDLAGASIATGFHPRERGRAAAQFDCLRQVLAVAEDVRRTGSAALDLAYVAAGRLDGYFEAGVQAWDIAAGMLMVRDA